MYEAEETRFTSWFVYITTAVDMPVNGITALVMVGMLSPRLAAGHSDVEEALSVVGFHAQERKEREMALLQVQRIAYLGDVIDTVGAECIASFPGKYAQKWD